MPSKPQIWYWNRPTLRSSLASYRLFPWSRCLPSYIGSTSHQCCYKIWSIAFCPGACTAELSSDLYRAWRACISSELCRPQLAPAFACLHRLHLSYCGICSSFGLKHFHRLRFFLPRPPSFSESRCSFFGSDLVYQNGFILHMSHSFVFDFIGLSQNLKLFSTPNSKTYWKVFPISFCWFDHW